MIKRRVKRHLSSYIPPYFNYGSLFQTLNLLRLNHSKRLESTRGTPRPVLLCLTKPRLRTSSPTTRFHSDKSWFQIRRSKTLDSLTLLYLGRNTNASVGPNATMDKADVTGQRNVLSIRSA